MEVKAAVSALDGQALKCFSGYICRKHDNEGSAVEPVQYFSYDHCNGYRSAIIYLYRQHQTSMSEDCRQIIKEFFEGYERKIATLKQMGEMNLIEGKQPLSFAEYRYLAELTLSKTQDIQANSFAHCFLTLCWNLIARCSSVSSLMFQHISWENDAMKIVFPLHKGDQEL